MGRESTAAVLTVPGAPRLTLGETDLGESRREEVFRTFRVNLGPEEAAVHWSRLLAEHARLASLVGEVDIRTSAFDYFLRQGLLREPVVVERPALNETELLAHRDALTGLYNYGYFENELSREVSRVRRYDTSICLVLLDLDGFKTVNDHLGHGAGNEVLRSVAELIASGLRTSDIAARLGGDEFAMLLHRAELATGLRVAARKREAIERYFAPKNAQLRITVSLGVAALPAQARTAIDLYEAADRALYHAKRSGRNRLSFHVPEGLVCLNGSVEKASRSLPDLESARRPRRPYRFSQDS